MAVPLRVTVLGSGTSLGVPAIGCDCAVCHSADPRDRRTRPSILIQAGDLSILVDTSTDLRMQALANDIRRVDAILFTHNHADHVFGLDDVRRFNQMQRSSINCYADAATVATLRRVFSYAFDPTVQPGGGLPQLSLFSIAGPFCMTGVEIVPVPLMHGRLPILGFRIGSFAYLTDCNHIPDASWPILSADGGVRTVIIDDAGKRLSTSSPSAARSLNGIMAVVGRLPPWIPPVALRLVAETSQRRQRQYLVFDLA